ncbi:MAG: ABC transporter substrate-binding protein [Mesotoga sp.]|nr:ABC transporter substrate-binding protein [Mesotoga sp.]HOI63374.1 ABC transporter substrate-binding protein [Mesotoga sp.]
MKIFLVATLLIFSTLLSATVNFINPVGPTLVPIAQLLSSNVPEEVPGLEINFWRSVDEAISLIVGKKAQLSLLPVTIGAKLASSGIDIKLAAVSMWNGFYFITIEKAISSVEDLVGMEVFTLHAPGQTADIILKGAIEKSSLKIGKDIKIAYVGGAEAVQLLASGKTRAILVPEPFATLAMTKVEKAVRSMPIEELWASFNEEKINIPTSGLFVSGDLDRSVVEAFLMLYGQSMSLSLADRVGTASVVSEKMGGFPIPVLEKAIDTAGFRFADSQEARREVTIYLRKLFELDPELTGEVNLDGFFF